MNKQLTKRIFDFTLAFCGLILILPFLILLGFLILLTSGRPIIFRQKRVGQAGRLFDIYKFRTMKNGGARFQFTPPGDKNITPIGKFLRKYKFDELPQLVNVLKGEMSLVGPRPEVPQFAKCYSQKYFGLLNLKPGITDFISLKFIEELVPVDEKIVDYDDFYRQKILPVKMKSHLEHLPQRNFFSDIKIICQTVAAIFKG